MRSFRNIHYLILSFLLLIRVVFCGVLYDSLISFGRGWVPDRLIVPFYQLRYRFMNGKTRKRDSRKIRVVVPISLFPTASEWAEHVASK